MPKGAKHTLETIAKMRAAKMGDRNPMKRQEVRDKNAASQKGKHDGDKNPMKHPEVAAKQAAAESASWTPARRAELAAIMRGDKNPMKRADVAAKSAATHRGQCRGDKNSNWHGGISWEPYAWEFNDELKEEVRRRDGYKCQLCGAPQAECKRRLSVHHCDYCKTNSDPVNLVALCNTCNAKVNANREHWTAHFRALALKRDIAAMSE